MTRAEAYDVLCKMKLSYISYDVDDTDDARAINVAIEALKEEPRPTAHWEEVSDMWGDSLWRCDHCGIEWTFIEGTPEDNGTKYCPNCGAIMEAEECQAEQ